MKYKHLFSLAFRVTALGLLVAVTATGIDWSLRFALTPEVPYPIDASHKKDDVARRSRTVEEEFRREDEEDEDDTLLPAGSPANPWVPLLPPLPQLDDTLTSPDAADADDLDVRGMKISAYAATADGVPLAELAHCKAAIERTLDAIPPRLTESLDTLTLHFSPRHEPRGLSNSHAVELRCGGLTDREIVAVLVHELGHIVDLGAFRGASRHASSFRDGSIVITADDPSADFYGISWRDSHTHRVGAKRTDFISGYAMTDPFEDFAESFIAYILHGDDFRALAEKNAALAKKYAFLRDTVFDGVEYESAMNELPSGRRVWDVTLVPYDLSEFWQRDAATLAATKKVR